MIKIGMMIGDRYEILEKIGTGGMSDVYKAKCHKLNRYVAIKVLKQEFSENANFVSKFRIEAQAAAGLMHPNIVNVYDVGEENGIYYIVMELVEGITLKKYIEKKARLSYKEAVSIAIQVSMGIEAAHNNHIIHRDIKPQNIIISKDGKVKVTDFGIAKAATSNTITSNVMGSVHYTSPEQDGTVEAIEAGLTVGSVSYIYSDEVGEGMICYQSYSHGSYVDQGTSIDIKVSQGAQKVTYKCNVSIAAPTTSEAPGYVSGMEVSIKLVTDDNNVLLDTKTSTFPVATNFNGMTASGGTLTITYQVTSEPTTTTNPDTGEQVTVPGTTEDRSFTRRVEFVKE